MTTSARREMAASSEAMPTPVDRERTVFWQPVRGTLATGRARCHNPATRLTQARLMDSRPSRYPKTWEGAIAVELVGPAEVHRADGTVVRVERGGLYTP
jgi:hypothetical protein